MTADGISFEDFQAFIQAHGGSSMAPPCCGTMETAAAAAQVAGISLTKHIEIMLHFNELAAKYSEVFEKPTPAKKPNRKKAAMAFEPDETPNCGCARRTFVVQSRIPAIEKYRNWKTRSGDLTMKGALQFIEEQKHIRTLSNGPKHKYRIIEKTVSATVVHEE